MSKQLLRNNTSVAAMVQESEHAETKKDFALKKTIGQQEINESIYEIKHLKSVNYLTKNTLNSVHTDAAKIIKLIATCIKTNLNN